LVPAVPIRKSVTPDYIVCLEDGKKLKMLKRHLSSTYNLTPDGYRAKWGLPPDYPMTAPTYAAQRSSLAKSAGLGRKAAPAPVVEAAPAKRPGRSKKSAA
jgi:predicted transcriptional regulator